MTSQATPTSVTIAPGRGVGLIAFDQASALGAVPHTERLAAGQALQLILIHQGDDDAPIRIPEWATKIVESTGAPWKSNILVASSPVEAVALLCEASREPVALIAVPSGSPHLQELRRLVASPPCDLGVLFNADLSRDCRRILIATNAFAPLSKEATELSYRLIPASTDVQVDFLRLVDDEDETRRDAIKSALRERIAERSPTFSFDVLVEHARSFEGGLLHTLHERDRYDLVLVDAPRQGLVRRLSERIIPRRLVREDAPILLYAAPIGGTARSLLAAWNVVYQLVPAPTEEDRIAIYARVRRTSRANADFNVLLSLSVVIAAFGLLLDSPAVVIGAMIIAPLMQPVVGVGLGVATANGPLTRIGAVSLLRGIVLALVLAFLIGLLVPSASVTSELDARGQPNNLDLLIALASGAAGAYATARKGAAGSVAGVAIAVALVPPLATAGIALALGERALTAGAALLFATNVIAIGAMSAIMFLWMGFKPDADRFHGVRGLVRGLTTLLTLVAVVAFFLVVRRESSDLQLNRRVFNIVEIAVQGVDPEAKLASVTHDTEGSIIVIAATVETTDFARVAAESSLIQSDVTRQLGRPAVVRLQPAPPD
ncbi:MAG: DUF389 domain-containing protein [Dehalococcoidia bacterium]